MDEMLKDILETAAQIVAVIVTLYMFMKKTEDKKRDGMLDDIESLETRVTKAENQLELFKQKMDMNDQNIISQYRDLKKMLSDLKAETSRATDIIFNRINDHIDNKEIHK